MEIFNDSTAALVRHRRNLEEYCKNAGITMEEFEDKIRQQYLKEHKDGVPKAL